MQVILCRKLRWLVLKKQVVPKKEENSNQSNRGKTNEGLCIWSCTFQKNQWWSVDLLIFVLFRSQCLAVNGRNPNHPLILKRPELKHITAVSFFKNRPGKQKPS